jgi:hypothetical protein
MGPGPSASDAEEPVPEGGVFTEHAYSNRYFGFSFELPKGWEKNVDGPPPSDTGYYVLAQFRHWDPAQGSGNGTVLIAASDLFFLSPALGSPRGLIENMQARLSPVYRVEAPPVEVTVGSHSFIRLDYQAPAAALHWRILASEFRCHVVEFIFVSRDVGLLDTLVRSIDPIRSLAGNTFEDKGNEVPVCIRGYASGPNLKHRVDPSFSGPRYTNVPVRIVVDRKGRVRQIHVISAFPGQAENVKAALAQWEFKPYVRNGRPAEVETGILFEFPPGGRGLQRRDPTRSVDPR